MTRVGDVMTSNPIVAEIPGSRSEMLRTMVKHNLTGMPVIRKDDGTLAGLITRNDIFDKPEEEQLALVMNRAPDVISPDAEVETAAKLMLAKKLHHLPVVDGNKLIGILTPTDLLVEVEKRSSGRSVESCALSPCVPIHMNAPLMVALMTFRVSKVNALPVLDDQGRLIGILTDRDIFNKSLINGSMETSDMGIGNDEDEWDWEGLRSVMKLWFEVSRVALPNVPVKDIMINDPTTVFRKTGISDAAKTMRRNDFGQLPVVDSKDNLVAMLYDIDVISILAEE